MKRLLIAVSLFLAALPALAQSGGPVNVCGLSIPGLPMPPIFVNRTIDAEGSYIFADSQTNTLRKVSRDGIISTIIGDGEIGRWLPLYSPDIDPTTGEPTLAKNAVTSFPNGPQLDLCGNIIFSEAGDSDVRLISPDGILHTVAGSYDNGNYGVSPVPALQLGLDTPIGDALDIAGNIYINDVDGDVIWMVNRDGMQHFGIPMTAGNAYIVAGTQWNFGYAGDGGPATQALLGWVRYGVAVDSKGNLYIADSSNNIIRRVDVVTGIITTVAGSTKNINPNVFNNGSGFGTNFGFSGDGGKAEHALLNWPRNPVFDAFDNLYFSDAGNAVVRRIDNQGIITTVAGQGSTWLATTNADCVVVGADYGVLDRADCSIFEAGEFLGDNSRRLANGTVTSTRFAGEGGLATEALLLYPNGLSVDILGNLYFYDTLNYRQLMVPAVDGTFFGIGMKRGNLYTIAGKQNVPWYMPEYSGDGGPATEAGL